jgi:DNA replication licensing factor MCM6
MIRLSEALARLHCDDEIQPPYVREAFRLLKTSIIQVETSDVDMDDDDENPNGNNDVAVDDGGEDADGSQNMDPESQENFDPETQAFNHPGEYGTDETMQGGPAKAPIDDAEDEAKKASKKNTKISFEEYEAITNAIATHLRSLESDEEESETKHMTWKEVVEWYIEQMEHEIGDSVVRLTEMRKKINLVIRRLVNVDQVVVTLGNPPANKREEQRSVLAVHPNYEAT